MKGIHTHVALLIGAVCCALVAHPALARRSLLDNLSTNAQYLYVWAGPQDKSLGGKDSLFVISLAGTEYGQVVNIVATPYAGIEPHVGHKGVPTPQR